MLVHAYVGCDEIFVVHDSAEFGFGLDIAPGIKADAQKAKETGGTYDPRGAGAAWYTSQMRFGPADVK